MRCLCSHCAAVVVVAAVVRVPMCAFFPVVRACMCLRACVWPHVGFLLPSLKSYSLLRSLCPRYMSCHAAISHVGYCVVSNACMRVSSAVRHWDRCRVHAAHVRDVWCVRVLVCCGSSLNSCAPPLWRSFVEQQSLCRLCYPIQNIFETTSCVVRASPSIRLGNSPAGAPSCVWQP